MLWIVPLLLIFSLVLLPSTKFVSSKFVWLLALVPLALFLFFISLVPEVMQGNVILQEWRWFPLLDVNYSLRLDGLGMLFALLITSIGVLIVIYSIAYLEQHKHLSRYFSYLFFFMAAMLGIVMADNLLLMFVFWEMTSISSYLLIGFDHEKLAARKAALNALLITSSGALFLLAGIVLIRIAVGSYDLTNLLEVGSGFTNNAWYTPILILVFVGAFTKSAQFPFHFWLPNAMEAPTPVSAYLHSATMVQAGVYLLARLHPVMAGTPLWFTVMTVVGAITMLIGVLLAFKQTDMKLILAYTTVTALGSLVFLLGSNEVVVIKAAVAFIISHALYKATLFMVVGDIQRQVGTRQITKISGLSRAMPITLLAAIVAGASMAGLPPLLGFYVKELVYEANLAAPIASTILTAMVVFANMMVASLAFVLVVKPFFGKQKPAKVHEARLEMSVNAFLLAVFTMLLSVFPFVVNKTVLSPAISAILQKPIVVKLSLWHGFTPSLGLSLMTVMGAIILYLKRVDIMQVMNRSRSLYHFGPAALWDMAVNAGLMIANWQTRVLQSGKQRIYLTVIFLATALLLMLTLITQQALMGITLSPSSSWLALFLGLWILASAVSTMLARSYLVGLVYLGMFGLGIALLFLVNAAPDVAMTQVLIETLIVIIVVLNLYRLPVLPEIIPETLMTKILNVVIAISIGLSVTLLLLSVVHHAFDPVIGHYYLRNSLPLGHGKNVVNVILVDFRAMDTLGEVIVVMIAAIGVYGLLKKRKKGVKA